MMMNDEVHESTSTLLITICTLQHHKVNLHRTEVLEKYNIIYRSMTWTISHYNDSLVFLHLILIGWGSTSYDAKWG